MNTGQTAGSVPAARKGPAPRAAQEAGIVLSPEQIEAFLNTLEGNGGAEGTVKRYRHNLHLLYADLPADKELRRGTLAQWRESLLERGYAPRTVNVSISVANSLLAYLGRRELQLMERLEPRTDIQPEMTRAEYLRLLGTARALGKRQLYLLIKLFAGTGLPVQALPGVTVEAAASGSLAITQGGERQVLHITDCLRQELLDFAKDTGRRSGALFVTGAPMCPTASAGCARRPGYRRKRATPAVCAGSTRARAQSTRAEHARGDRGQYQPAGAAGPGAADGGRTVLHRLGAGRLGIRGGGRHGDTET